MKHQDVQEFLDRSPFEPFAIQLTTGESYVVRNPGGLLVGTSVIYYPIFSSGFVDRIVHISVQHIVRIEPLREAPADGTGNGRSAQ